MKAMNYVNGVAHIGVPTTDMEATLQFYGDLGFELIHSNTNNGGRVCFLECQNVQIETYEAETSAMVRGGIDHVALDCTDIEACFEEVKKLPYPILEGITFLPFWEKGIRYFLVQGPNMEVVEFCQKL
ncbi:MAG: VOC family protein [Clostridiales bacterium]|nr:VOC family protein [Clostridiales bacterium]